MSDDYEEVGVNDVSPHLLSLVGNTEAALRRMQQQQYPNLATPPGPPTLRRFRFLVEPGRPHKAAVGGPLSFACKVNSSLQSDATGMPESFLVSQESEGVIHDVSTSADWTLIEPPPEGRVVIEAGSNGEFSPFYVEAVAMY